MVWNSGETISRKNYKRITSFPSMREINILLLGSTGVGKTTFINSLANYFTYSTFEEAIQNFPKVLTPLRFTMPKNDESTNEIKMIHVQLFPEEMKTNNEDLESLGISTTQKPKIYSFEQNKYCFKIIDVPGIGDTRGIEMDSKNIRDILDVVGTVGELNLICILLKSNQSRLTTEIVYCLNALILNLHKKAIDNIAFVFTNSRGNDYNPGESYGALKKYLNDLESHGVKIPLNNDTIYCIDSEPFRYHCYWHQNPDEKPTTLAETPVLKSWNKSSEALKKMLQHAKNLEAYKTINTMSINEARCAILLLLEPLAMILSVLESCKIHCKDVLSFKQTLIDGNVTDANLQITSLGEFQTVCTSEKCSKIDNNDGIIYQTCHKHCKLPGIRIKMPKDEKLKDCAAFEEINENGIQKFICLECGCSFEDHIRIAFTTKKIQQTNKNSFLQKNLQKKSSDGIKEIIKELENEKKLVEESAHMFGKFLKENAILTSNNAFEQRLLMEIKKLEQENNYILASKLRQSLENFKKNEENLEKFASDNKSIGFPKRNLSSKEISKQRIKLFEMELYGLKIKEIYETQKLLTKNDISDDEIVTFSAKINFV